MATNPELQYVGKIAPATPAYPYGGPRNITLPGDGTGTPWEAAFVSDLFALVQSALQVATEVPTNSPDEVGNNQTFKGFQAVAPTIAGLIAANLTAGQKVSISGRLADGDGGASPYLIKTAAQAGLDGDVIDGFGNVTLANGNVAIVQVTSGVVRAEQYGMVEGDVDNSDNLIAAVAAYPVVDFGSKTFKIKSETDIVLARPTLFIANGGGLLVDVGDGFIGDMVSIDCNGFSFGTKDFFCSGAGTTTYPFYIFENQDSDAIVTLYGGSFDDSYSGTTQGNTGLYIRGGLEEVKIFGTGFKNHTRAQGAGNPGISGTSGLTIDALGSFDVKNVVMESPSFIDVTNGEVADTVNNIDADGVKIFASTTSSPVRRTTATISNAYFKNCKGRAVKSQNDVTTVINPTIYRNISGITGASVEIDLQIHGGDVISPTFFYEDSTSGEATFVRPVAPISIFAPGTLVKPRICNISDVTIHDNTTIGSMASSIITASQSDLSTAFDSVVNVTNVISDAEHAAFMTCPALTGGGTFYANVNNVYVKEIDAANGLFGFASSADLKAKAFLNVDRFTHAGTETKPTYQTTSPASLAKPTLKMTPTIGVSSTTDNGVSSHDNRVTGVDENDANTQNTGLHVFSQSLADDATMTIEIPNVDNRGIATITTTLSRLSCGVVSIDSSGALNFGAGAQANFNPGGAVNPDVDGDLNIWATGGNLLIKNRLGSTRTITVSFQG